MASQTLRGRKVAILLAPAGSEQAEFTARLLRQDRRGFAEGQHPAQARSA
jgi:hypothetical protein